MKNKKSFILLIILTVFSSCKNYYNETISWADNLKQESNIEEVKKLQPSFVEISWSKPLLIANQKYYEITKIDGNHDILNMQNFLVFEDDKYVGREAMK
jgi:hypothetical protein